MKNETVKDTMVGMIKQVRDDIEDGKLDKAIKDVREQNPMLFLKAALTEKQPFLPKSEK